MPADHPRVSVVMPVRNGRAYIHEAIASVLEQSFTELELIVVDDGSDDFDYRSLEALDARVRVLRLEGRGVSAARNAGLALARGELLSFLDADDVWCPGKLEAQVRYLDARPEVGMVFGRYLRWHANAQGEFPPAAALVQDCHSLQRADPQRSGWLYGRLLTGLLVGMNTAMLRRGVLEQIGGFRTDLRLGEDHELWLRVSRVCQMHSLDGMVALYRVHPGSATQQPQPPTTNVDAMLLEISRARWGLKGPWDSGISLQQFQRRLAALQFQHGYAHYWRGDARLAARAFGSALRHGHRPLRSAAYALLSWTRSALRR